MKKTVKANYPHVDSGERCLAAHVKDGALDYPCIKCRECGRWIRPEEMADGCPGRDDDGRKK